MASQCLPVLQFDTVRVTRLNNCGAPVDSTCAYAVSEGVITLAMTNNNQDRQEYLQLNGQGNICVDEAKEAQLRWINFELTFCNVDPELFNIITSAPLVLNDAAVPLAIGWDTTQSSSLTSYFALEAWTNTGGSSCEDGTADYGYFLLPFAVGAEVSDITLENANINFTITGRTKKNALWGTGPYNVRLIEAAGATNGDPAPLLTTIGSTVHRRQFWTELPPPAAFCGCQDLTPTLTVTPLSATAVTVRTMTIPLDVNGVPFAGVAYWGDASAKVIVAAGTTSITHTYAVGSYTATFKPTAYSTPTYTSATIVAT